MCYRGVFELGMCYRGVLELGYVLQRCAGIRVCATEVCWN